MVDGAILYLNTKCNIDCEYCFVTQKDNTFMTRDHFEKILVWLLDQEGDEKDISFFGGEPLLNAQLLWGLRDFLKKINTRNKKIEIKDINSNGLLLDEEMLERLKKEDLRLIYSLDGLQFEHNKFRMNKRATFEKTLKSIELYRKNYETPSVNCVIHPTTAENFDVRIREFFENGFNKVRLIPTQGVHWSREQVEAYRQSFIRLLHYYFGLLKSGRRNVYLHPLVDTLKRVLNGRRGEYFYNRNVCQMGRAAFFMPDGKAYGCRSVMFFDNPDLIKKFDVGHIDTGIDTRKIESFMEYKQCQDVKTACTATVPGASCKKLCLSFDLKTGKQASPEDITTMLEVYSIPFILVNNIFNPQHKFKITQDELESAVQAA